MNAPALTRKHVASPFGVLRLFAADDQLVGLYLPDRPVPAAAVAAVAAVHARRTGVLEATAAQLAEYFAGRRRTFAIPIAMAGTAFQRQLWELLRAIPYGETRSYGELARLLGRPAASRAVGAANGANPISIIVPCHRVLGTGGQLTGYAGGLAMKRGLLELERAGGARRTA